MPIHEESYAVWEGAVLERPRTWIVIARTGVRLVWRRVLAVLLFIAAIPFLFRAGQIYLASRVSRLSFLSDFASAIEIDAGFFMSFMRHQTLIFLVIVAFSGAGLIANDRKYNALPLYFARPVHFWDYVSGKFAILVFYGGLVTVVPALLLFVLQLLLTEESGFFAAYYWVPPAIIAMGAMMLAVIGGITLAVSALARGTRSAVVAIFALVYIPDLLAKILSAFRDVGWISIHRNIEQVASVLFTAGNPRAYPSWVGFIVLVAIVSICIAALRWRIKPTEVVT
jgi:ABC-2 type transport system permease protein